MRSLAARVRFYVLTAAFAAIVPAANAGAPAPVGARALLSFSIQIDGAGQYALKSDGVDVKWSTHRTFDAKVEMVADKAEVAGTAVSMGQAAAYKPSTDMAALQKQAQQCKSDDMACQMELAAKMMETDDAKAFVEQARTADAAPARYQTWQLPAKGGRIDIKADYQEQWDGVFLTASREVRTCKISATVPAAGSTTLSAKDRGTLEGGLKGLHVEIDTQTGKNWLLLAVASFVEGAEHCHSNDGGHVTDESEPKSIVFNAPIDLKSTGGWVEGGAASGTALARGEINFETKAEARNSSGAMSVKAPLKVKIRWEMTRL